jgi:hypothetical protein
LRGEPKQAPLEQGEAGKTMKVKVEYVVDVDRAAWDLNYGTHEYDAEEFTQDVQDNLIDASLEYVAATGNKAKVVSKVT